VGPCNRRVTDGAGEAILPRRGLQVALLRQVSQLVVEVLRHDLGIVLRVPTIGLAVAQRRSAVLVARETLRTIIRRARGELYRTQESETKTREEAALHDWFSGCELRRDPRAAGVPSVGRKWLR